MEITPSRLKHSIRVATKMRELVSENETKYNISQEDAFILGFLHDIGYGFTDNAIEHARVGGLMLQKQGYKYWQEVYWHGTVQEVFDTPAIRLLNYVDLTTGPNGEEMTPQERLKDIEIRHGEESDQAKQALKMYNTLNIKEERAYK